MRILLARFGAFGDNLIITPLIRKFHKDGHEVIVLTNERGMQVFKNNPNIQKLIEQKTDSVPIEKLADHIKAVAKENLCDKAIDLSESIEVALSLHPRGTEYNLPKYERRERFEINFYEYTFEFAENLLPELFEDPIDYNTKEEFSEFLRPELFFDEEELVEAKSHLKPGFNLLVGMSGSGTNKAWPWMEALCGSIKNEYKDAVHIITVGDERCRLIEPEGPGITNLSGKTSMRVSMALTSLVDCVICPDTGLLHAAGCYDTPKIGLLGHNTKEVITKHFLNDLSIEADETKAECAPCFRLIYNKDLQCPTDYHAGGAAWCMSRGIPPEPVFETFKVIYNAKS